FCETMETAAAVRSAGEDRRLGKANLTVQMGGMAAAVESYSTIPTPNVIILETDGSSDILAGLDQLATVCDAGTRVVVIGSENDVALDSVVIDLDLAFGTASLDYNQDPVQGIANAVFSPDRLDTTTVERLLAKCSDRLSLLASPASLERVYDLGAEAFDSIFDT